MGGTYTVAVVGATGAVGQQMVACLEERKFPVHLPLVSYIQAVLPGEQCTAGRLENGITF